MRYLTYFCIFDWAWKKMVQHVLGVLSQMFCGWKLISSSLVNGSNPYFLHVPLNLCIGRGFIFKVIDSITYKTIQKYNESINLKKKNSLYGRLSLCRKQTESTRSTCTSIGKRKSFSFECDTLLFIIILCQWVEIEYLRYKLKWYFE